MKTRNLKTKTLSILLTIVMLLGMLPLSVFAASTDENKVITLTPADLVDGASGEGWSFNGTKLTIESGYTLKFEGTCGADVENYGTIESGTFSGYVNNDGTIESGSFSAYVDNFGTIEGGSFNGTVTNYDTIESGTFDGEVSNLGTISGGTFNHEVFNSSLISGGTFTKQVTNDGTIENGIFDWHVANNDHGTIESGSFSAYVDNFGTIEGGNFSGIVSNYDTGTIYGGVFTGGMGNYGTVTGAADLSTLGGFDEHGGQYGKDVKLPKAVIRGDLTYIGCDPSTQITLHYYGDDAKTAEWTVSGEKYSYPVEKYRRTDPEADLSGIEGISHKVKAVPMDGYEITIDNPIWDRFHVTVTRTAPDLTITGGTEGTDYTYENGVLDIKNAGTYEIKNADNVTATDDVIKVSAPSGTVNITLSGVVINVSGTGDAGSWGKAAFEITGECATNLILKDGCENVFDSGYNRAGIANHSHPLTIACEHSESATHECSESCGHLRAVGQLDGAGIGGDAFEPGTNITIKGGNIVADIVNQSGGAGIGGGYSGNGSNITITGGTVTATGSAGAGIGGGDGGNGDNITISGGKIIAGDLEAGGAGIGGGDGGNGRDITITGGNVVALSRDFGIKGDNITITGGEVLANTVAGIGGIYGNNIRIAPAENTIIYAYNGSRTENTPLDGSPFTGETDIRALIDGNSSFYCYAEHVHSFSADWTYDEDSHWHAPTCGHEDAAFKVSHSYGTEWKSDSTNHWYECTCGAKTEEAAHSYGTEWKSDGTNHWRECTCGVKTEEAAHSGGTATCTEKAKCTVCAVEYGNLAEHTYGTEWKSDGTNHWHECSCGAKTEEAAHSGGTATCTEKAKCTVCTVEYGELAEHTYGTEWKPDGTNHWRECSCEAKSDEAAHSGGTATCTEKAKCTVCTVEYGELAAHIYGTEWKSNGTNHWHECSCGVKTEEAVHSGGTATCKDKAACSVCNIAYGELAAHTYEKGKCTVCKATDPNYVPETDNPQTGDNSNMALWMALLLLSAGAIIALTVVDRKRRSAANK